MVCMEGGNAEQAFPGTGSHWTARPYHGNDGSARPIGGGRSTMEEQRGAEAVKKFTEAQELRQIGRELEKKGHPGTFEYMQADRTEKEAEQLLKPAGEIVRGSG